MRSSYQKYKLSNNNNSIESVYKLLKRSGKLENVNLTKLLIEYKSILNTYTPGTLAYKELKEAIENINEAMKAQAVKNANANAKAKKINVFKGGNFSVLNNKILTNLTDEELKGILQKLSLNGKTDEHKEMMKNLLKKWIESGKNLNSAEISKKSKFIKSLEADIKKITNNYALRQKFIGTESKISERTFGWNDPNTIKKALLSQNGRQKIITTYGLPIPLNSPIPEIVSALHDSKQPKFVNTVKLNSLKTEYQRLRDAYSDKTNSNIYKNLTDAINSIPNNPNAVSANANANAELRAKVNQVKKSIPEGLLNNPQAKVGLVLKSNGSPYKLVNYTKLKNAINKFKDTGKNQPLNNNTIITNAAKGTWNLVEVPRNLLA